MSELDDTMRLVLPSRVTRATKQFQSPAGQEFAAECAGLAAEGDIGAYYAPAIRLAVDTTIMAANHKLVSAEMPAEIAERFLQIKRMAHIVTATYIGNRVFDRLYRQSELRWVEMRPADDKPVWDEEYLTTLTQAPFGDISWAGGGAFKLLTEAGVEQPRHSIERSTSLLAISGISRAHEDAPLRYFGMPYIAGEHLRIKDGDLPTATFTADAYRQLREWQDPNGGCLAGRLPDAEFGTTIERYWPQLVGVLIPDHATADHEVFTESGKAA